MDNQGPSNYNLNLLRGWQRSQLKMLKKFAVNDLVSQEKLSLGSGARVGTKELGGKMTALTRAGLIQKAGKDKNGQWVWQLNEEKVEKETLKNFLDSIGINLDSSAA